MYLDLETRNTQKKNFTLKLYYFFSIGAWISNKIIHLGFCKCKQEMNAVVTPSQTVII